MMKKWHKCLVFLLMLSLGLGSLPLTQAQGGNLAPDGESNISYYAPFPVNITLDGDIADWEGVPHVRIGSGDLAVSFAAAADLENIYFMGDVTDPNIIMGQHAENYWNEDSLEFYINGTGDLTLRSYKDGVAQVTIPALNMDLALDESVVGGVRGSTVSPQVKVVSTETGYRVEMAVPLVNDVWNISPTHGGVLGFQVHLNSASAGDRDAKLIWSMFDTNDSSYQNPSVFGFLIFYEVGQTDLPSVPAMDAARPEVKPVSKSALYKNGRFSPSTRVGDLLPRMTLDEKIAQMTLVEKGSIQPDDIQFMGIGGLLSGGGGYPTDNNTVAGWAEMVNGYQNLALSSRLGIPMIYGVDAVHGHNNLYGATIFPHNIGLGASRNPELVEKICRATALETIATGIYWDYSPVVAVVQDARWGRTYESYGENTELVTELALACMQGLQGGSFDDGTAVLATIKHYVGDGGAMWGTSTSENYQIDRGVTDVDEATLRAIHLPPYVAAIENGALSIMVSFSSWGGLKMHAQQYLITDVLKGELAFEGFVVSDWAGVDEIAPDDYYASVVASINAGVDMVMVPSNYLLFMDTVKQAVNNGDIPLERIDDAVTRILTIKFAMGLFENPLANPDLQSVVGSEEHRAIARQAVVESQVLLKNEGELLPLDPATSTIFVAGNAANDLGVQSGGWTIEWQGGTGAIIPGTTILEGIQNTVSADTQLVYAADGDFSAESATPDAVIVVVGEPPYAEGRGDSATLTLPEAELQAIENARAYSDNVIVVIVSGRPLMITDYIDNWDAVVASWLPGSEGQGVADVLFGVQPFTGKLSITWMASVDQLPLGSSDTEPLFPFGFGLETTAR